jgi:hypothetical protein
MKASQFKQLVGSHFFHVDFIKADGSIRHMNARCNVAKYVKGTGKAIDDGRVGVFEVNAGREGAECYRSLWPDKIVSLKVGGVTYDVDGRVVK